MDKYRQKIKEMWTGLFEIKSEDDVLALAKTPIRYGLFVILIFFVTFGLWGLLAPIDSAAISQGQVILFDSRKTIQHLEGGIIGEILVEEGDVVQKGDPLLVLEDTMAKANLNVLKKQRFALHAKRARLIAERDLQNKIDLKKYELNKQFDTEREEILNGELKQFNVRKDYRVGQLDILEQKIMQLQNEIRGLSAQEQAAYDQLTVLKEQEKSQRELYEKGFVAKQEVDSLKIQISGLQGDYGTYIADIAKVHQTIAETRLEVIQFKTQLLNEVVAELQDASVQLADLDERIYATKDTLNRTTITAPQPGIITGLQYHTTGGIIAPGSPIMNIVPQDDELIIESKVNPQDIDIVTKGQRAKVKLSAYQAKNLPSLDAEVIYISADNFVDENTGMTYYMARTRIEIEQLDALDDVELYPGMPVEVYFVIGERTFFKYLLEPITKTMRRAFREE